MKIHNFHMKIDSAVRQRLEEFSRQLGMRNSSCLVKKFVEQSRYILEQRYFEDGEQVSHYALVNDDLSIERVSLHIDLEEGDYRWLKQNHQDLNFYSIAQIIRWIICWGIELLKLGVDEAKRQWQKITRAWEKKRQVICRKMKRVRQLFASFRFQTQELGWVSIYNSNFSPFREIFSNTE